MQATAAKTRGALKLLVQGKRLPPSSHDFPPSFLPCRSAPTAYRSWCTSRARRA